MKPPARVRTMGSAALERFSAQATACTRNLVFEAPDHIHVTGVPRERPRAVSLHMYGRMMSSFNTYDVAAGTRRRVEVAHNES